MGSKYKDEIIKRINIIDEDKALDQAALKIAEAFEKGNKTYTFGTGHSHMLGEELYSRAGGWNYIIPMLLDELTLSSHPFKSTYIERVAGFSEVL
ncbi:MAG: SIS domain-containing protein, partial [Mycoplasmataceae bacterium]|nr:SIS domain-containing protein [Mycoplasmataceae bacterium]